MPTPTIEAPTTPVVLPDKPFSGLIRPLRKPLRTRPHRRKQPSPRPPKKRPPRTPEQIDRFGPSARLDLYRHGELTRHECFVWAARFPEEIPLVNGELPWIALSLADLD